MMRSLTRSRRALYRWTGWFFFINVLLSMVSAIGYIKVLPHFAGAAGASTGGTVLAWAFLAVSFFVQYMLLFFLVAAVVLILVTLFPRRWLVFSVSALLSTVLTFSLVADSFAFALYRMHSFIIAWKDGSLQWPLLHCCSLNICSRFLYGGRYEDRSHVGVVIKWRLYFLFCLGSLMGRCLCQLHWQPAIG